MAGGSEELSIIVRMRDFATRQFNSLGGTIGKWAQQGMQKVGQFVKSMVSFHGILGMIGTAWGAMRMIDHIAEVEDIGLAFESLTKKVGGSQAILEVLRRATRGTVSDFKLMETANKAILLGVGDSAEQFEMLATLARRLGRAVGRDTVDAFNDLTMGIGRQSRLILDNLGLIVKVEEANEAYAKALGVTASNLTETQKKQAFMNAVMESARVKVEELGEDTWTMSDAWGAFKATLGNLGNDILRQTLPILTDLFTTLQKGLVGNREALMTFAGDVVEAFANIAEAGEAIYNVTIGPFIKLMKELGTAGNQSVAIFKALGEAKFGLFWDWIKDGKKSFKEIADAADKSTSVVGDRLRDLAKQIRTAGSQFKDELDTYRLASKVLDDYGDELDTLAAQKKFFIEVENRWTYKAIDLIALRAARQREEIAAHNQLYDAMKRVQELRAKFDFAPPLIEPPKGQRVFLDPDRLERANAQLELIKESYENLDRMSATAGAAKGFAELMQRSREWGIATYEAIMQVSGAIGSNLVDGIIAIGENFREAGKYAREFAAQLLKDLARILLQMAMMQAVQAGMGALGGLFGLGGNLQMPVGMRMPHLQHGGIGGGLAIVGEAGPEIVHLPGGSRVYPNSSLGNTVNVNITNVNPQFRTPEQERSYMREQRAQIRAEVLAAMGSSTSFREGMS